MHSLHSPMASSMDARETAFEEELLLEPDEIPRRRRIGACPIRPGLSTRFDRIRATRGDGHVVGCHGDRHGQSAEHSRSFDWFVGMCIGFVWFPERIYSHSHVSVRAPDRYRADRCPRLMARARTIPARLRPYWRRTRTTSLPKTGVARFRNRIRNFLGIAIGLLPNMRVFAAAEPIGIAMPAPAARRLPARPWPSPPRRPSPSPPSMCFSNLRSAL